MTNKFVSALEAVGHVAEKVLGVAAKIEDNTEVQNLESLFIPAGVVKLISTGLDSVAGAEQQMAAAGFQNGTGAQKLQIAAAVFTSDYAQYAQENGLDPESPAVAANVAQITSLLAQVLNLIPQMKNPAPTPIVLVPAPAAPAIAAPAPAIAAALTPSSAAPAPAASASDDALEAAIANVTKLIAAKAAAAGTVGSASATTGGAPAAAGTQVNAPAATGDNPTGAAV
jgi:hypothetical protein